MAFEIMTWILWYHNWWLGPIFTRDYYFCDVYDDNNGGNQKEEDLQNRDANFFRLYMRLFHNMGSKATFQQMIDRIFVIEWGYVMCVHFTF